MSDPVLTFVLTVAGGVLILALGRVFEKLIIDPVHRLRSLVGEIEDVLAFHAPFYASPGGSPTDEVEASAALRAKATQLRARRYAVVWYPLWAFLRLVPKQRSVKEASKKLIGLSNAVHSGDAVENIEKASQIRVLLRISPAEEADNL